MACSECLPTLLNPLAERTCTSQVHGPPAPPARCVASPAGPEELLRCALSEFTAAEVAQLSDGPHRP